jgi:type VI secretion system protein ImpB
LADLSGQPTEALPRLKDRRFVEITPDNFDGVLESFKPHLSLEVDNKLSEEADAGKLKVDLDFKSLDDFDPASVAKNVKPLKELLDLRQKLGDLRGALQGNDKLDDLLMDAVGNTQKADQLKKEIQKDKPKGGSDE